MQSEITQNDWLSVYLGRVMKAAAKKMLTIMITLSFSGSAFFLDTAIMDKRE